jgi:hypothetical protein
MTQEELEQEELEAAETGTPVVDAVGDAWEKLADGGWGLVEEDFFDGPPVTLSSHDLLHVWGPVRLADA